jgi:hypothetical protein
VVVYYNSPEKISGGLDYQLIRCVAAEYERLKEIIGYGEILEKESIFKIVYGGINRAMFLPVKNKYKEIKRRTSPRIPITL